MKKSSSRFYVTTFMNTLIHLEMHILKSIVAGHGTNVFKRDRKYLIIKCCVALHKLDLCVLPVCLLSYVVKNQVSHNLKIPGVLLHKGFAKFVKVFVL